jgi:hypothetical protein
MKLAVLTAMLSTLIFHLVDRTVLSPGRLINGYFPCRQDPNSSFPCYGTYDITALILCGIIFSGSLAVILVFAVKRTLAARKRKKP